MIPKKLDAADSDEVYDMRKIYGDDGWFARAIYKRCIEDANKTAESMCGVPTVKLSGNIEKAQTIQRLSGLDAGASGDTELFEKASNINGFQGGRVANNLYISPFRATVFQTAALFLYPNSSVVIRVENLCFLSLWLSL